MIATLRSGAHCARCRTHRDAGATCCVITTMPKTTAASGRPASASAASAAAAPAASGRSLRLRSAKRADAPDRDREDEGDADAGDQRGDHRLQQLLGLDDRRDHPLSSPGPGRPRWARRAKTATISESDIRVTSTGPSAPVPKIAREAVGERADRRRRRQGQQPGDDDVAGHPPAHRREPLAGAGAHHAAVDHVGGREREAEVGRGEDHRRARALGREALRRVHLDDPGAGGADDPPAAAVGAERDRGRRGDDHPGRRVGVRRRGVPLAIRARVITPIVFCASLVPWASASSPPETIWP